MKKIICFLFVSILFISCSFNYLDETVIAEVNHYNNYEKNEEFARDLLFYRYNQFLLDEIEGLDKEDLAHIKWRSLTNSANEEVSLILQLNLKNSRVAAAKERLITYFKVKVRKQINYHIRYEDELNEAQKVAGEYLNLLKKDSIEEFWIVGAEELITTATPQQFVDLLQMIEDKAGKSLERTYYSRQFYDKFHNTEAGEYFQFNYIVKTETTQYIETIILKKSDGLWKVVGYHVS